MVKHARKRQKTGKEEAARASKHDLITDDASKDDEERRLESILFGTKYVERDINSPLVTNGGLDGGMGNEMRNLLDQDLFFLDGGLDPTDSTPGDTFEAVENLHPGDDSDDESQSDGESQSSRSQSSPPKISSKKHPLLRSRKPPAWTDPADHPDEPAISISSGRLRKLRDAPAETEVTPLEYESRLRRQYERINPAPTWAVNARKHKKMDADEEGDSIQHLLSSTSGILDSESRSRKKSVLPSGVLGIERLRDINQSVQGSGSGEVKVVTFHPSSNVPVVCVGTADRRYRLFNVDGHTSPLLHTLHIPSLPVTSPSSAQFHPQGSSLLLTGPRPFFYVHDFQSGATVRHSRGLWGTTFSATNDAVRVDHRGKRGRGNPGGGVTATAGGAGLEVSAFSPGTGDLLAVAGRGGYIHLVDWGSGAGQVIGSLKCGGGGGGIKSLWWTSENGGEDAALGGGAGGGGRYLAAMSGDAEVYIWDVGERKCVRRWKDDGGFRGAGRVMTGCHGGHDGKGGWLAVGSNIGFVNVYDSDSFHPLPVNNDPSNPKPIKSIANLTTAISTLRFNHDAQILAIASREKRDALRLIHLPSLTSFSNWPTSGTPLGHVSAVDFSARSEYIAIGNTRGKVLLYHLKEYGYGSIPTTL